jgi:hypothetical protein
MQGEYHPHRRLLLWRLVKEERLSHDPSHSRLSQPGAEWGVAATFVDRECVFVNLLG